MPRQLRKALWNLRRFGFTPDTLPRRLSGSGPRIVSVSVPKAGTHLLERALCLDKRVWRKLIRTVHEQNVEQYGGLPRLMQRLRPGELIVAHLPYSQERIDCIRDAGVRCLFMLRDPRAVVCSQAHYVATSPEHHFHELFVSRGELRERIRLAIHGDAEAGYPSIRKRHEDFAGWLTASDLVVRFEDLIGEAGGGSAVRQAELLGEIYAAVGLSMSADEIERVRTQLFSSASPTFRKGSVGEWRQHFDEELTAEFAEVAGDIMTTYGYATDLDATDEERQKRA